MFYEIYLYHFPFACLFTKQEANRFAFELMQSLHTSDVVILTNWK